MKKQIIKIVVLAMLAFTILLPTKISAADGDIKIGSILLASTGTVTIQSPQAADEKISSLQLSISVQNLASSNAVVAFAFSSDVTGKAKVYEARYANGTLNLYVSGTTALFNETTQTLQLGNISITNGSGSKVSAKVEVASLKFVYGTDVVDIDSNYINYPAAVTLYTSSSSIGWWQPVVPPSVTEEPTPTPQEEEEDAPRVLELTMPKEKTCQLGIILKDAGEKGKIEYSSSNEKIASVSGSGRVTAKESGKATITIKLPSGKEMICRVIVK